MFDLLKYYYDKKIYSREDVAKFVMTGKISEIQFEEITGVLYQL